LFAFLLYVLKNILKLGMVTEIPIFENRMIFAKSIMTLVILAAIAYLILKRTPKINSPEIWVRNIFLVMALAFLLSPVQNPLDLCWAVPFLCIFHLRSLIFLTGLIGLYYLDFYFDYQDITQYSILVAWLEYTPFYIYLVWELTRSGKTLKAAEQTIGAKRD